MKSSAQTGACKSVAYCEKLNKEEEAKEQ